MNKLDYVIGHFFAIAKGDVAPDARSDAGFLSAALEEIRDLLTADKQEVPEEQPATFEPWDCVRAKPGSHLAQYTEDAELVLGHRDSGGDWKVFNPDDAGERGVLYCQDDELIFVRRLKPRAQAEDTEPTFAARYINDVQAEPQFKAGEYVENIFDAEGRAYEVMHDTNGPQVQLRDCKTGQPIAFDADDLRKVEKPAPFQVGDWVRDTRDGEELRVIGSGDVSIMVQTKQGVDCLRLTQHLTKIDPPAPRFTFGDRVRVEWGEIDHIFLGYDHCGTHADVIGHEKNIHNIPIALISAAPLDTDAD
jgi:hypothetical protein